MSLPKIPDVRTPTQVQVAGLSSLYCQARDWWAMNFATFREKLKRQPRHVHERKYSKKDLSKWARQYFGNTQWECSALISGYADSRQTGHRLVCVAGRKFTYYINSKVYMYVRKHWPSARVHILPDIGAVGFTYKGKRVAVIMGIQVGDDDSLTEEVKL